MKATVLLQKDHERVREMFAQSRRAKGGAQAGNRALIEEICKEITIHSHIETEIFYPALRETSSKRAEELVEAALQDHKAIDDLIADISNNSGNDKALESKMQRLIESVVAHIDQEEEEIFVEARREFSEQKLEELGLELEVRRRMFTQAAA